MGKTTWRVIACVRLIKTHWIDKNTTIISDLGYTRRLWLYVYRFYIYYRINDETDQGDTSPARVEKGSNRVQWG